MTRPSDSVLSVSARAILGTHQPAYHNSEISHKAAYKSAFIYFTPFQGPATATGRCAHFHRGAGEGGRTNASRTPTWNRGVLHRVLGGPAGPLGDPGAERGVHAAGDGHPPGEPDPDRRRPGRDEDAKSVASERERRGDVGHALLE